MSRAGDVKALRGWERAGLTWCRKREPFKAEVSRERNPDGGVIEWRAFVWEGTNRARPILDAFTGQDVEEAVELATQAMDAGFQVLAELSREGRLT